MILRVLVDGGQGSGFRGQGSKKPLGWGLWYPTHSAKCAGWMGHPKGRVVWETGNLGEDSQVYFFPKTTARLGPASPSSITGTVVSRCPQPKAVDGNNDRW